MSKLIAVTLFVLAILAAGSVFWPVDRTHEPIASTLIVVSIVLLVFAGGFGWYAGVAD